MTHEEIHNFTRVSCEWCVKAEGTLAWDGEKRTKRKTWMNGDILQIQRVFGTSWVSLCAP